VRFLKEKRAAHEINAEFKPLSFTTSIGVHDSGKRAHIYVRRQYADLVRPGSEISPSFRFDM
jgi:hypothetical protein